MKTKFNEIRDREFQKLEFILPVVSRVHGGGHPELLEVDKLFDIISNKIKEAGSETALLDDEFKQLRGITNNYTVPRGVCESYRAVYDSLKKVDEAYNN